MFFGNGIRSVFVLSHQSQPDRRAVVRRVAVRIATVHLIHQIEGLFFHLVGGVEVTLAGDLHRAVTEPPLDFLDIHARFAKLRGVGVAQAVEVEFLIAEFGFDDVRYRAIRL